MLPMRKNEFLSGMPVPEVSSEEVWDLNKVFVVRRIVMPDRMEYEGERLKGGRWLREASYLIAADMIANKAVKVEQDWDVFNDRIRLTYVAKVGQQNSWRCLPC